LAIGAGEVGLAQAGLHVLRSDCQANQRAPEREERLVNVGPTVIPHAQAAKLMMNTLARGRECARNLEANPQKPPR
jgi:hypothetical protein